MAFGPKGQRVTISERLPGASKVKHQGNNPKRRIAKSPRPLKSVRDGKRVALSDEAQHLLQAGIRLGKVSSLLEGKWPECVWAAEAPVLMRSKGGSPAAERASEDTGA